MRWRNGRKSDNVEDRRGVRVSRGMVGGGIGTIIVVLLALSLGVDPTIFLIQAPTVSVPSTGASREAPHPGENRLAEFISVELADTEDTWKELFRRSGDTCREPVLVLFPDAVESACGFADSAVGPFYRPKDRKIPIDLGFCRDLKDRFRAPGDFAQTYGIAHEVGHRVQNVPGISEKVQIARARPSESEGNRLSVRLELQADCLAGVRAHHANRARNIPEAGDVEEALGAASGIGDDRLQKQARGYAVPDAFTHGTSEQRDRWFQAGIDPGTSIDAIRSRGRRASPPAPGGRKAADAPTSFPS